jgi:hypothetical protein
MLILLTIPEAPPRNEVDESLSGVLSYAHQHGFQFGKDVIYTCGPLAFLTFPLFSPHAAGFRMVVDLVLSSIVAAGLCLLAWRLRVAWRCLLIVTCVWVTANMERPLDLMVDVGLLAWGLLCFVETGPRLTITAWGFTALGAFVSLSKVSFFFEACLGVALIGCVLGIRGYYRLALGNVAGFVAALVLQWIFAGQDLRYLFSFLVTWPEMMRGYGQALSWEGLPLMHHTGMLLVLALLALIATRTWSAFQPATKFVFWLRGLAWLWVSFLTFAAWKHGYMRGDAFHVAYFLGFAPMVALALNSLWQQANQTEESLTRVSLEWFSNVLACGCYAASLVLLQQFSFVSFSESLRQPLRLLAYHARCLWDRADYRRRMMEQIEINRREAQLPEFRQIVGQASVDFFGQKQAYVLFNDLNYRPRPVLQSYAACTARLMQFNQDFYLSKDAPEYVMFQFWPIDRKFSPLEDARVLRHLLINYNFVAAHSDLLLLKSKSAQGPRLSLLHEGTVARGQPIDLRPYGDTNLWMEVDLKPSWLGSLRQFFYQPPTVRIAAWADPTHNLICRQRAPSPMLSAGFIASPLLRQNQDVVDLYAGKSLKRPAAYTVDLLPAQECYWQEAIRYRIYRIENQLGFERVPPTVSQPRALCFAGQ